MHQQQRVVGLTAGAIVDFAQHAADKHGLGRAQDRRGAACVVVALAGTCLRAPAHRHLSLRRHPEVYVRALTINPQGQPIFLAHTNGGDGAPFVVNRSAESLGKALNAGIVRIANEKVAPF